MGELKQLAKISKKLPTYELSSLPQKAVFTRYADDWVLCISGTKEDAIRIKGEIEEYVTNVLLMKLSREKTLITHMQDGFSFLGYSIKMNTPEQDKIKQVVRRYNNKVVRTKKLVSSRKITIGIDMKTVMSKFMNIEKYLPAQPNLKTGFKPIAVKHLKVLSDYEIVLKFRQKFMGFYMYYRHCDKTSGINFASYVMQYSCAATLAAKHNRSIKATFEKYGNNLTVRETFFMKDNNKVEKEVKFSTYAEMLKEYPPDLKPLGSGGKRDPFKVHTFYRTKFKTFCVCCICGETKGIELHHLKSVRRNKNKRIEFSKLKSDLNRNQIPVCKHCHDSITHGKYNDVKSPIEYYDEFLARF